MSKPNLLVIDTLDDRREIHLLLAKLNPRRRVLFLQWCCSRAHLAGAPEARPHLSLDFAQKIRDAYRCDRGDDRLTATIYLDLLALGAQYVFDLPAAVVELERWSKGLTPSGPIVIEPSTSPPASSGHTSAPASVRNAGSTHSGRPRTCGIR